MLGILQVIVVYLFIYNKGKDRMEDWIFSHDQLYEVQTRRKLERDSVLEFTSNSRDIFKKGIIRTKGETAQGYQFQSYESHPS